MISDQLYLLGFVLSAAVLSVYDPKYVFPAETVVLNPSDPLAEVAHAVWTYPLRPGSPSVPSFPSTIVKVFVCPDDVSYKITVVVLPVLVADLIITDDPSFIVAIDVPSTFIVVIPLSVVAVTSGE